MSTYKLKAPDFDFMRRVEQVATNSGCTRRRFGAIAVKDGKILAEGANTSPGKIPTCMQLGACIRDTLNIKSGEKREVAYCLCAEQMLIAKAAKDGIALDGATMYVSAMPCPICIRQIIATGLVRVIFKQDYPSELGLELAKLGGLELVQLP